MKRREDSKSKFTRELIYKCFKCNRVANYYTKTGEPIPNKRCCDEDMDLIKVVIMSAKEGRDGRT